MATAHEVVWNVTVAERYDEASAAMMTPKFLTQPSISWLDRPATSVT